jgi:hypothetical protein
MLSQSLLNILQVPRAGPFLQVAAAAAARLLLLLLHPAKEQCGARKRQKTATTVNFLPAATDTEAFCSAEEQNTV